VTSVSGTGTVSGLSLSGTVTSAGSLTLGGTLAVLPSNFASQTANTVLAAPNGSAGTPTFRAIVAADIPTLNQNTTGTASNVTGIVAIANGGTGASVAATARTNLSAAASGANTDITSIALTTGTISTSPVNGTDIVNKAYADSIASGINFHQSVRLATAAALPANTYNNGTSGVGATLTANANGALSVDGVVAVAGNRILVKDEAAGANNGVYVVTQVGSGSTPYILTRATDFDSAGTGVDQIDAGDFFLVTAGSTLSNTSWVQQTPLPITVGTTPITFTQFAAPVLYSAGTGLTLTGTTFSITNTGVAASTYGSASSVPVIAVNAQGQLTSASSSAIAIAASQITSGALAIANGGTGATSAATALTNLGAYPASNPSGFTSNTGTVTSVNLTAGTGVSVSGGPITSSGSITVTNTAPDQVVSLTGSGATTVTGTYPNFTISSPTSGAGTVTSINVSGGTTGLTTSGGPVTSSGTITLAGTLNVANGGTGATTLSSGYLLKGNGTSAVSASVIYDDGTNAMIGGTSAFGRFTVEGNTNANLDIWIRNNNAGSSSRTGLVLNASGNSWRMGMGSTANNSNALTWNLDVGGANTEYMRLTTGGNLGLNTTTPTGRLSVVSGSSTGADTPAWNNNFSVFGPNAGGATGAAIALGYNTSADAAEIIALAPAVAWKPLNLYSAGLNLFASSGGIGASLNGSGTFSAVTDIRAPIFYDSGNTAFYLDPNGSTSLNTAGNLITSGNLTLNNGANRYVRIGSATNYSYDLQTTGDDFQIIEAGTTPRLTIKYPSGNLGVGTASPSARITAQVNSGNYILDLINGSETGFALRTYNHGSGSAPGLVFTQGLYYNTTENASIKFYRGGGATGGYLGFTVTDGTERLSINSNGNVIANVDMRAPIFYDSNDTAFYINPNSASVLSDVFARGQIRATGWWGSQSASGTGLGIEIGQSGGRSFVLSYNRNATTYGPMSFEANDFLFTGVAGGFVATNNSFRAPIFYDSDNTGYYLNPNGTSLLSTVNIDTLLNVSNGSALFLSSVSAAYQRVDSRNEGSDARAHWYGVTTAGATSNFRHAWYDGAAYFNVTASSSQVVFERTAGVGSLVSAGDMRSPIFYDSNNTGYYLDPNGTSNLLTTNTVNLNVSSVATFAGGSYVASNGDVYARRSNGTTGVYYFADGGSKYLFWDGGQYFFGGAGVVTSPTSFRAPIFYDSDNTSYYVDPASGTVLGGNFSILGGRPLTYAPGGGSLTIQGDAGGWGTGLYFLGSSGTNLGGFGGYGGGNSLVYLWAGTSLSAPAIEIYAAAQYAQSPGSFRAPIFYDSNNTAYYVDPATATNLAGTITQTGPGRTSIVGPSDYDTRLGSSDLWFWFKSIAGNGSSGYPGAIQFGRNDNVFSWPIVLNPRGGNVGVNSYSADYTLHVAGTGYASTDFRAPIFYDSNNTGYYLDPASTSVLNQIQFPPNTAQISGNDTSSYGSIAIRGSRNGWYGIHIQGGGNAPHLMFETGNGGIYFEGIGRWGAYYSTANNCWGFGTSSTSGAYNIYCPTGVYSGGRVDGTIFYDSNNTAYYVDPNSTSNLVGLTVANVITGSVYGCTFTEDSKDKDNIATRTDSGFYQSSSATAAEGWPINDGNWQHMISCTHGNDANYFAMQLGASFFSQGLFYRSVNNSGTQAWSRVALYGNNYGADLYASIYYDADNTAFYLNAHSTGTSLNVAGSIVAAGNVTAYSDIRVKANVETIPSALDKLDQIRGVTYTRTDLDDKEQRYAGVIAQEIEAVLPEAVRDLGNIKAVDYNATIGLLIQAVKELTDKVKALEAKEQ
jgi:hypothetical protein